MTSCHDLFVLPKLPFKEEDTPVKSMSSDTWLLLATAWAKELYIQYPDGTAWSVNTG